MGRGGGTVACLGGKARYNNRVNNTLDASVGVDAMEGKVSKS